MRSVAAVLALVLLAGCGGDDDAGSSTPPEIDFAALNLSACNSGFHATDDDESFRLSVYAADDLPAETEVVMTIPDDRTGITARTGTDLMHPCDDVQRGRTDDRFTAVSGTVTFHLDAKTDGDPSEPWSGDVLIEDVLLTTDDGKELRVDRLEWTDIEGTYSG